MLNLQKFIAEREAKKRAIKFVQEVSFVNATPVVLVKSKDENWEAQVTEQVKNEMEEKLKEALPFTIAVEPQKEDAKRLICLVVYASEDNEGYYLYGCSAWIKVHGRWRTYYPNREWEEKKKSPGEDLKITYSGCCGDVNTWYGKKNVKEYFYTY